MNKELQPIDQALSRRARRHTARARSHTIVVIQRKLQRQVSKAAWRTFLRLEERVNARHAKDVAAAVRLAFRYGQRALLAEVVRRLNLD